MYSSIVKYKHMSQAEFDPPSARVGLLLNEKKPALTNLATEYCIVNFIKKIIQKKLLTNKSRKKYYP